MMGRRLSQKGFSLIEVIITVAVLSIGIVAVHQALGRCLHAIKTSEETLLSSQVLQNGALGLNVMLWDHPENEEGWEPPPLHLESYFEIPPGYEFKAQKYITKLEDAEFDQYDLELASPSGAITKNTVYLKRPDTQSGL